MPLPAIERFVLGCGNFGGIGSAPELFGQGEDEPAAFALMDAAWELGIRWFDTADAYGGGRSETAIGRTEWAPEITRSTSESGMPPRNTPSASADASRLNFSARDPM